MLTELSSFRNGSSHVACMEVGSFRVLGAYFPPLLQLAPHSHERAGCSIVLEGGLEKDFSGKSYESPSNSVVTMPPEERHEARFTRQGARMLIIEPRCPVDDLLQPCAALFGRIQNFRDVHITSTAWRINCEVQSPDDFSPLAVEGLVLELLVHAARRQARQEENLGRPPWLYQAQAYLHEQFSSNVRIGDLATTVGVHPVHLARVFREQLGYSPGEYLRRLRLEWAATQLTVTEQAIGDVALAAGFADQSHFTRAFKRQIGLTPGQYRRETTC